MMRMGYGLRLGLHQEPRTLQILAQMCSVCRQAIAFPDSQAVAAAKALGGPYAVCVCCHQPAPEPKDRNYRARSRRWLARPREPEPPTPEWNAFEHLGDPIPAHLQDRRTQELDANRRRYADEIGRLSIAFNGPDGFIEDGVYRFYHQSFKVSILHDVAEQARDLFTRLCPAGCQLNPWFMQIGEDAKRAWTSPPDLATRNANWIAHARPVVEFAFHCEYFLTQLVRYEGEDFAPISALPSGVAAVLYLYGLR